MYNYTLMDSGKLDFVSVASVDELPNGERIFIEIDGISLVVFNIAGGYFAIADICSHDEGPLGDGVLDGHEIKCPRHGARFDVHTGKVLSLPAYVDIPAYATRVVNGMIEVGIPIEK